MTGSVAQVNTQKANDIDGYVTFVENNHDSATQSTVYTNGLLTYNSNASSEKLTVGGQLKVNKDAEFDEDVTLGSASDDKVTFNSKVDSHIFPSHNATSAIDTSGKDLGDSNNYWRKVYAKDYAGTFTGTITSRNIKMTGDVLWDVDFDASADVEAAGTIQDGAVEESMLNITDAPSSGNVGYFLKLVDANGTLNWSKVSGTGSSLAFTDLTDTLSSYSGSANKLVAVNSGATGLIFTDASTVGTDNYVDSMTLNSTTLTLGRTGSLTDLTQDLSSLSGATTFLGLTDTPSAYTNNANKIVTVNGTSNALVFTDPSTIGGTTYDIATIGNSNQNLSLIHI